MAHTQTRISRVGGVIAAAGGKAAKPTLRLGAISIVQRLVYMFQQAGIFPVIVVTGVQADEVRYQLAERGVVFLHNDRFAQASLFESSRLGLDYVRGVTDRVVFSPVNSPLVSPDSLQKLLRGRADVVRLSHKRRGGHPVMLSGRAVEKIVRDERAASLRDALKSFDQSTEWIEAEDEGAVLTVRQEDKMRGHISRHGKEYFHPHLRISLENEDELFSSRLKVLLFLVSKTGSVAAACRQVALSGSTAWEMINRLESALGCAVITRSRGGAAGSGSSLTPDGVAFLKNWQRFEESVHAYATKKFGVFMRRHVT